MASEMPVILSARGVVFDYGEGPVLDEVSFDLKQGEFVGLAGPNGAGKSTLLRLLTGLSLPARGQVELEQRAVGRYSRRELARRLAMIFQTSAFAYDFTVFDMVAMGRTPYQSRWRSLSMHDRQVIDSAMEMTDVRDFRDRLFVELSGGEKQRVIIAKALAQEPSILLLDEPSTHLDLHHQVAVFGILEKLNRDRGVTILCITHDLTLASQYIDRFLLLKDGRLLAEGPPDQVVRKDLMEDLYRTPVHVGRIPTSNAPCIYALKKESIY